MHPEYREESRRHVSSVVLNEERLGEAPQKEAIRYVEVPTIEEIITRVPKKEIIEVEKRVPKYEYEWVEKVIEVPVIQTVDKHVEVEQIQEVIRHVPRKEIVEVPKEFVRHVPKVENKIVERRVEVPGDVVEVPKPYTVENRVSVPNYIDKEVPFVVAQSVKPVIKEGGVEIDVDVYDYQPQIIPVDIPVSRSVKTQLVPLGITKERHRVVQVPAAHYNSMLKHLNSHLLNNENFTIPFVSENGSIPLLSDTEFLQLVSPLKNAEIEGYSGPMNNHDYPTPDVFRDSSAHRHASPEFYQQARAVPRSTLAHGAPSTSSKRKDPSRRSRRHRRESERTDRTPPREDVSRYEMMDNLKKSPSQTKPKTKTNKIFC